jgi:hypothetical protein
MVPCELVAEAILLGTLCRVKLSEAAVVVIGPPGSARTLMRADLSAVVVETHMTGDYVTDVWWLLYGRPGETALRIPQGSSGEEQLVEWLMSLPGFHVEAMARAMRFRGNATFELWRASDAVQRPLAAS